MARVPYVERQEMDAEGQEIYDRIRRDRNADNMAQVALKPEMEPGKTSTL